MGLIKILLYMKFTILTSTNNATKRNPQQCDKKKSTTDQFPKQYDKKKSTTFYT